MYALRHGLQATGYCVGVGCLVFFCLEQTLGAALRACLLCVFCCVFSAVCCLLSAVRVRVRVRVIMVVPPRFVLFVHMRARV